MNAPTAADPMLVAVSTSLLYLLIPSFGLRVELPLGPAWAVRVGGFIGEQIDVGIFLEKSVWDLDARVTRTSLGTRQRGLLLGLSARHRSQVGLLGRELEEESVRSRQVRLHAVIAARWTGTTGVFIGGEAGGGATREWLELDSISGGDLHSATTRASLHADLTVGWMWR